MKHLFLSPHFDDAVLSCGGTIQQLVAQGESVEVRTIMAGLPHKLPDSPFVHELHARWQAGESPVRTRIREDELAVGHLGAACTRLSFWLDCIYRVTRSGTILYPDGKAIFAEIHPEDVAAQLLPTVVLSALEIPEVIYAPLGAGHHIDHQIVRNWAINLKHDTPWVALKFYEEYPYTEDPQAVNRAMSFFNENDLSLGLRPETVTLDEAAVQAKIEAIGFYTSQISSFWPDLQLMDSVVRQSLLRTGEGTYAERYWELGYS
ncbi:MAG: PIG-L family deacetylase [Chloroflexi bacterium]|nr:PIG-L family deacetylase [Chloroflexota bacterium]MCC6895956.1 PIG-L family deacetylase [Anaerolineae bacterium]